MVERINERQDNRNQQKRGAERRREGEQKRKTVRKWRQIPETEGMIHSFLLMFVNRWKRDSEKISQLPAS